jgi:hypothetical protein
MENQYDAFPCLKCRDCKHCNNKADLCPINHTSVKMSKPWFATYDVGNCPICKNFEPRPSLKWLYERWEGLDRYLTDKAEIFMEENIPLSEMHPKTISLIKDNNFDVRYVIPYDDWFNCNVDIDNYLYKSYYKRSKDSPFGYKLIKEYKDNTHN